jgi:methyl-accepting chemotaxis protein WspA
MKTWNIRHRIIASFAAVLALMLAMSGLTYNRLDRVEEDVSLIREDALPGLAYSGQLMSAWLENHSLTEAHLLDTDTAAMESLESRLQTNLTRLEDIARAYEATFSTTEHRANFEGLRSLQGPYFRAQAQMLALSRDNKDVEARALLAGELSPAFERIQAALQEIVDAEKLEAEDAGREIVSDVGAAKTAIVSSLAVACLLAFACGYLLFRSIVHPLLRLLRATRAISNGDFTQRMAPERRDELGAVAEGFNQMVDQLTRLVGQVQRSGIQVNTSATQIAATAREQQATASEIAATTTEIGATSREISATSRELVKTMSEVSRVAEQAAALAGSGQNGLATMAETMQGVMGAAESINAKLAVLNAKAGNITQVVTTITKVADQTNLLSLNAAIEAEKAGEFGRGFAVVATEIRRLADQTAVSTLDIEQMVKEIQSAVSAGVMGMDKFSEEVRRGMQEVQQVGHQLSQVIEQVQVLAPRFEAVNEGMQAQATGAEQISQALTQLTEAAQQTVESLRQSNQAIDGLNQATSGLHSGISRFKLA